MRLNTKMFGLVELDISIGLTNSAVDAYPSAGYIVETGDALTENQLEIIDWVYADLIQEYAVNELGCHWD